MSPLMLPAASSPIVRSSRPCSGCCHPRRYPGGICKIRFWRDGEVGEGTQIRRHQARVTIHDCLIFHNLPISDSRAAYLKTRNTRLANVVRTTAEADRFAANLMPIGDQKKFRILAFASIDRKNKSRTFRLSRTLNGGCYMRMTNDRLFRPPRHLFSAAGLGCCDAAAAMGRR